MKKLIYSKEDLDLILTLELVDKDKEIERLKEELEYTIPIVEHNKTITKHLKEIERLNNIINEINSIVEYWGYDKEQNDISSFRMAMKSIKDILGSDKE